MTALETNPIELRAYFDAMRKSGYKSYVDTDRCLEFLGSFFRGKTVKPMMNRLPGKLMKRFNQYIISVDMGCLREYAEHSSLVMAAEDIPEPKGKVLSFDEKEIIKKLRPMLSSTNLPIDLDIALESYRGLFFVWYEGFGSTITSARKGEIHNNAREIAHCIQIPKTHDLYTDKLRNHLYAKKKKQDGLYNKDVSLDSCLDKDILFSMKLIPDGIPKQYSTPEHLEDKMH